MSAQAGSAAPAEQVAAGALPPWSVGSLEPPPRWGLRSWVGMLGPGVLLAGASIGTGEWVFGPEVTAQYGGTLLWLATLSIIAQVFCNLEMMRYTLYCGEPILVGCFRSKPGPMVWLWVYLALDFAAIWPFNAAHAAGPLAAAILGHLPGNATTTILGITMQEATLSKLLGYAVFLAAFVPLVFGGVIYRVIERIMTAKLVFVLVYLLAVVAFLCSWQSVREVAAGFLRIGQVPLRAQTVLVYPHFTYMHSEGDLRYTVKGTLEGSRPLITEFVVHRGRRPDIYRLGKREPPPDLLPVRERLTAQALTLLEPGRFLVELHEGQERLRISGRVGADRTWRTERAELFGPDGQRLHALTPAWQARAAALEAGQGVENVGVMGYYRERGRLPPLDWALVAGFIAIAGAGGMSNTLFSNYCRDKGWGMGAKVGAIPSAFAGRRITLSHIGQVFSLNEPNLSRWRGWLRHVTREQIAVWALCSVLGMALPCVVSLEFIRNAPVSDIRVSAMTAEGMARGYAEYRHVVWSLMLLCGFLVLAPGQILAGDQVARRWTDIIWSTTPLARRLQGHQVKYVYYGLLAVYGLWGMYALTAFTPGQVAKIATVLMNVSLGFVALHTLYVNQTLLPPPLRPGWIRKAGLIFAGLFFFGITAVVVATL